MSGIIPSAERDPRWLASLSSSVLSLIPQSVRNTFSLTPGTQLGPMPYAPLLTSLVAAPAMNFLLGPCVPNRRSDGELGGMRVKKCKFLQESNCKGICLHQCKLPAEQFFKDLGVDLTVKPNFETQECQWSWGESPVPYRKDKDFPRGCIESCETRSAKKFKH